MSGAEKRRKLREEYKRKLIDALPTYHIPPIPDELEAEILRTGLIILGGGGTGKSTIAKLLAAHFINKQDGNVQVKIIDKVYNWVLDFEPIYYQDVDSETEMADFYWGEDHILYNAHFKDPDEMKALASDLVGIDYDLHFLYKRAGIMDNWVIWFTEEAHNILGRYGISGKIGKYWLTYITEGRNLNLSFVFIGRRAADISASVIENAQGYLFTKATGDRDKTKIKGICGKEAEVHLMVPKLRMPPEACEAIYWNGVEAKKLVVSEYDSHGMVPILWKGG